MQAQQPIAFAFNESLVGRELDVLIDSYDSSEDVWIGRTYADAPDVDGVVRLQGKRLAVGDLVPCSIESAAGYDLIARPVGPVRSGKRRPKPRKRPASSLTILD